MPYQYVKISNADPSQQYICDTIGDADRIVALTRFKTEIVIGDNLAHLQWWQGSAQQFNISTVPGNVRDAIVVLDNPIATRQLILNHLGLPPNDVVHVFDNGTWVSIRRPPAGGNGNNGNGNNGPEGGAGNFSLPGTSGNPVVPGVNWHPADLFNFAPFTLSLLALELFGAVNPESLQVATELLNHPERIQAFAENPQELIGSVQLIAGVALDPVVLAGLTPVITNPLDIQALIMERVGPIG